MFLAFEGVICLGLNKGKKMKYNQKEIYKKNLLLVSVSGGKDSTAMCLNLIKQGYVPGLDFMCVFADTGWEHLGTYRYLDRLEYLVGKIHRVKAHIEVREEDLEFVKEIERDLGVDESPLVRRILKYYFFPTRLRKWCTHELKLLPIKQFINDLLDSDEGDWEDIINLVGIRREESFKRSTYPEWEMHPVLPVLTHRPLIDWTEADVIKIHQEFNQVPNRLYLNGSTRVGCYPCINSRKLELKLLDPKRVDVIRKLEEYCQNKKNKDKITFFASKRKDVAMMSIDEVIEWANTNYYKKKKSEEEQLELFHKEDEHDTCSKWGMCEFK